MPVSPKNTLAKTSGLFGRRAATDTRIAREIGFGYVRWDVNWDSTEWEKGKWTPEWYDSQLPHITQNGLRALFILDFGNRFYDGSRIVVSDAGVAGFKRHVEYVVRRWGDMADFWEIWNEPNFLWDGPPNPVAYARLVRESAPIIKSIKPNSTVIAGALSQLDTAYMAAMLAAGIGESVDVLSVHPYLSDAPDAVFDKLPAVKAAAGRYPLTFTEWGYPTYDNSRTPWAAVPVTRDQQASYAIRLMLTGHVLEHPITIWYDASDDGSDPYDVEQNLGLVDSNLNPKPAYHALRELFRTLGARRADAYSLIDGIFTVRFPGIGSNKPAYVVWNVRDSAMPLTIEGGASYTPLIGKGPVWANGATASLAPNDVAVIETNPVANRPLPYRVNVPAARRQ